MKKITKLFLALTLLVIGVINANAEIRQDWDPSDAYGTTWTAETTTLSWNKDWANVLYTGFAPKSNNNTTAVDLSLFSKIHYNITSLTGTASDANGAYIDLKVRSTGKDDLTIKLREGANDIKFADYATTIDFSKILELTISATYPNDAESGAAGSAVITEMYLYTDRYKYQTQQQTVTTYTIGTALNLNDIVTNNSLVSITSGNDILHIADGGNQIKCANYETAMSAVDARRPNGATYQFRITAANDEGLVKPEGISTLYKIQCYNDDGSAVFKGPYNQDGYWNQIWCISINSGDDGANGAPYWAITPVEGKTNTYNISSYHKDGTLKSNQVHGKSEWIFNQLTQTQQVVDVQVPVEVFVPDTEDPGIPAVAEGWISLISNGNLESSGTSSFATKDETGPNGVGDAIEITSDAGRMSGNGLKIASKDGATNAWGTQFFILSKDVLKEGQKLHIEFDYRADRKATVPMQAHREPGNYNAELHNEKVNFTVNWQHYVNEITLNADETKNGGLYSIAFNLNEDRSTNNFYFDNIVLWTEDDPLKPQKVELQNAIASANGRAIGKTEASASALATAIENGNTALNAANASETSLKAATTAIQNAITGLKYAAGYAKVTKNMFMTWDRDGADANATGVSTAGVYNIGTTNAEIPYGYGTGNVYWNHYTDLTPYEKLYAIGTPGKRARYLFNRPMDPNNQSGEGTSAFIQKYIDINSNGVAELALSDVSTEFVHLNTFKRPDAGTTFTEFFVYAAKSNAVVGEAGYATFSSIMNVDLTGVTGYAAKYDGSKIVLTEITTYPAGAAIIIKADQGNYSLTNIESADEVDSDLNVSDGSVAGDGTIYVLAKGGSGVGFYKLATGGKVPAGKAYLKIAGGSSREFIAINNEATAIKSVETVKANGAVYNLAGQQVKNAQKGIYIVNGKKVIK